MEQRRHFKSDEKLQGLYGLGLLCAFPVAGVLSVIDYILDGCYQGLTGTLTCGDQATREVTLIGLIGLFFFLIVLAAGSKIIRSVRHAFLAAPIPPNLMPDSPVTNLSRRSDAADFVLRWAAQFGFAVSPSSTPERLVLKKGGVLTLPTLVVLDKPSNDVFLWIETPYGPMPVSSGLGVPGMMARRALRALLQEANP